MVMKSIPTLEAERNKEMEISKEKIFEILDANNDSEHDLISAALDDILANYDIRIGALLNIYDEWRENEQS